MLYGGKLAVKVGTDQFLNWLDSVERVMLKAETDAGFYAPGDVYKRQPTYFCHWVAAGWVVGCGTVEVPALAVQWA